MKEDFKELFDEVFDADGEIRSCGRATCMRLIQVALKLDPQEDETFYGDCNPLSAKRDYMNVQNLKALRARIK